MTRVDAEPLRAPGPEGERAARMPAFDVDRVRADFPILERQIFCKPLVFLDSAASSQKPRQVLEAVDRFYREHYSNIHRGVYRLSQEATHLYEEARDKARAFVNAAESREIIFVRGATEAINLVAQTYGRDHLGEGDEILLTEMEHHSNIVPWQILCRQTGAKLEVAPMDDRGEVILEEYETRLRRGRTKIVAMVHVSNALGTINPVKKMTALAHECGAVVLIDGAQAAPHMKVDVQDLGCDFYAVSGHKMNGPSGIGILYGKAALLEAMPPYHGGGEMILKVTFEETTYNEIPFKYEAGTPNIAGAIGLGAAIDYLHVLGLDQIAAYEAYLLEHGTRILNEVPGLRMIGTAAHKASVLGFLLNGVHAHDIGTILDQEGIAVRTGHHCAQPVMKHFGVAATTRASLSFFNKTEELDKLAESLVLVRKLMGV